MSTDGNGPDTASGNIRTLTPNELNIAHRGQGNLVQYARRPEETL
jgi:hypothetical protein